MSENQVKKTININHNTAEKLRKVAKIQDRSESSVVRNALEKYFKEH